MAINVFGSRKDIWHRELEFIDLKLWDIRVLYKKMKCRCHNSWYTWLYHARTSSTKVFPGLLNIA